MNAHDLIERYIASHILRPASIAQLRYTARDFGHLSITREHLVSYVRGRPDLSRHTLHHRLQNLICVWRWSAEEGYVDPPPRVLPRVPRPPVVIRATDPADVARVLAYTETLEGCIKGREIPKRVYWPAVIAAFFDSALRTSDLMQLRMDGQHQWVLLQIKTSRPVRVRPWPETLERMRRLSVLSPTLFDLGFARGVICRGIKRYAAAVGVYLTPQQLRRSAATAAEITRPGSGAVLLGHSDDRTTKQWYLDHDGIYGDVRGPRLAPSSRTRQRDRDAG